MLRKALTISRPLFWIGPFIAYAIGLAVAGVQRGYFEIWEMLLMTFPVSFYIYGLNDLFDIGSDQENPRKSGVWGEPLQGSDIPWVRNFCIAIAAALIITSTLSMNLLHITFTILGLAIPFAYSAPPLRLKNIPVVDSLSNLAYGFVPFAMAASLGGSLVYLDSRFILLLLILPAVHAITTIMDYSKDKNAGQKTFAVSLGMRAPAIFAAAIFFANSFVLLEFSPIAAYSLAFAGIVSIALSISPSPCNAKNAFKALFAYGLILGYFFFAKYFLFPQYLADYSEDEFTNFIVLCQSDELPAPLCGQLDAARELCPSDSLPHGICEFLENNPGKETTD